MVFEVMDYKYFSAVMQSNLRFKICHLYLSLRF